MTSTSPDRRSKGRKRRAQRKPTVGRVDRARGHRVLLLNKPYGVLCQFGDDGRPTLKQYVDVPEKVYAAGRLDKDSEGLVLLTDDGRLAHQVTHPRHKLAKTYLVQVEGVPDRDALAALRAGVEIADRRDARGLRIRTAPARVELLVEEPTLWPRIRPVRPYGEKCWLRLEIREGRKRQVRHMTAAVGHPTLRLVREAIGPLRVDGLAPGEWRDATAAELAALRAALAPPRPRR